MIINENLTDQEYVDRYGALNFRNKIERENLEICAGSVSV